MTLFTAANRLAQIDASISNKESHRATCTLMDFIRDYMLTEQDLADAVELRMQYNNSRSLGESDIPEIEAEAVLQRARELFMRISSYSYEKAEEALQVLYPVEPLITATGIEKAYPRQNRFKLGPVSTDLFAGQITGIVGENGNGKTTLLRILARLLDFDQGTLQFQFDGKMYTDDYAVKHKIAYIPQRLEGWHGTLKENLHYAANIHGITGADNQRAVDFVIHRMGLSNFAHLGWKELSSGYKLRFELAKTLVWSPKILVLDEPLANLDINAQEWILQDFKALAASIKNPLSIILSSQQLHEVEHVADNIIFLRNGRCDYSGLTASFMQERAGNVFEVSGTFSAADLQQAFPASGYVFTESGITISIRTDVSVSAADILTALIQKGYTIKYFRDISTSTKQLFQL